MTRPPFPCRTHRCPFHDAAYNCVPDGGPLRMRAAASLRQTAPHLTAVPAMWGPQNASSVGVCVPSSRTGCWRGFQAAQACCLTRSPLAPWPHTCLQCELLCSHRAEAGAAYAVQRGARDVAAVCTGVGRPRDEEANWQAGVQAPGDRGAAPATTPTTGCTHCCTHSRRDPGAAATCSTNTNLARHNVSRTCSGPFRPGTSDSHPPRPPARPPASQRPHCAPAAGAQHSLHFCQHLVHLLH